MADHSSIQWTEATWNPTVGCSLKSDGCRHCYAMSMAHRLGERMKKAKYRGLTKLVGGRPVWNGLVRADKYSLADPLHWHKPRMVFVDSMSDLFHGELFIGEVAKVFAIMALCPQHTFQILTKRGPGGRRKKNRFLVKMVKRVKAAQRREDSRG